jgi:multicomponent Na+:H+ antiporter subunit E
MNLFLLNLLLALAWGALVGSFEPLNLLFGFFLGYLILGLSERRLGSGQRSYVRKSLLALQLVSILMIDIFKANLRVAITVLSPHPPLRPAVVAVPLDLTTENAITLLSNLISLTPGTLSLDVSSDRSILFIHVLWLEDSEKFRTELKNGYERRIKELME